MRPMINFSGFLHQAVLLSKQELENLFHEMGCFGFYNVSSVQNLIQDSVTKERFLEFYSHYLSKLFADEPLDHLEISKMFSLALATGPECFVKQTLSEDRFLLKPKRSVIQMQPLACFVSSLDKQIHIKSFAKDAQSFGIKFSFPTIYEDTQLHKIIELDVKDPEYALFNTLRRFLRHKTTPVVVESDKDKKVYSFRYSQDLKEKIQYMPFFSKHGLRVCL